MTPHAKPLWRRRRSVYQLVLLLLVIWMVGDEINVLWGPGEGGSVLFGRVAYESVLQLAALLCVARGVLYAQRRAAWIVIGLGCMAWGIGDIYYEFVLVHLKQLPVPSLADGMYLSFYPAVFVGLVLLFRAQSGRASGAQWLDGLTAALAAAALSAALVLNAVLGTLGGHSLADATNLAYPVGDLLLLGGIAGALVVCGRRGGRVWLHVGLGISIFSVADGLYLVQSAQGAYHIGSWFDVGWPAGMVCLAMAAWSDASNRPARVKASAGGLRHIAMPIVFALISIGLLLYTGSQHLNWLARILATGSLGVVLLRLAKTIHDNAELTARRELESNTDALTGLSNRRALNADLATILEHVSDEQPAIVAIFDLDGFKDYNDTFGHPAGDALLARLGAKLQESIAERGRAYRMGGDEFCVLMRGRKEDSDTSVEQAVVALGEIGDGFAIRSSHGVVHIPSEAADAEAALRVADRRMYEGKGDGRRSAQHQRRDVLLRAHRDHAASLDARTQGVRELAEAVARRLDLDDHEVELIGNTAALHDIGKMAIPRSIISKPGRLNDQELTLMRTDTIIGERIISAAPVLDDVAKAVRATHERWDATGYPDSLPGPRIPLAARVVAVCDAFDAMTSDRPYAAPRSTAEALRELRRCAGSQFDPAVVEVFEQVLSARRVLPRVMEAPSKA